VNANREKERQTINPVRHCRNNLIPRPLYADLVAQQGTNLALIDQRAFDFFSYFQLPVSSVSH
jgi:hypothetical protein